ncbi:MAG: toll/interleukin-1 receptor domain-containing protein [Lysobacteraceae bacterium]
MADSNRPLRYRAFISYSHADEAIATRLHRRLERYRPPRGLKRDRDSAAASRIHPVFRDRDELAGAGQLSDAIEAALAQSAALIVICSPAAVGSRWVGEEIRRFRLHHAERPVLAFVVNGEPAADPCNDPEQAAFPLQLLLTDPADTSSPLQEPLAADARPQGDGFPTAFLKLVAGLLGVRFDQLRQRDLRRRQRLWTLAIAGSLLLSACFAVLAWQAIIARDAAREAQARAELELTSERQTRDFLLSIFELADAGKSRGNQVTVREVLDRAVARIDDTPFERPAIKSRFLATMGQAYDSLGINKRAAELLRYSLQELPDWDESQEAASQRIDSQLALADVLFNSGEYEASIHALDTVALLKTTLPVDPNKALTAVIRGDVLIQLEQDEDATLEFGRALDILDSSEVSSEDKARWKGRAHSGLALLQQYEGNFEEADAEFAKALNLLSQELGPSHPDTVTTRVSRASNAYFAGNMDVAKREWQHSLQIASKLYDPLSPDIGTLKNNLGRLALETDDLASAESMLNDAIASDRKFRTENFDDLAYPLNSLAMVKLAQGDADAARELLDEALLIAEAANHPILGPVLTHIADLDCESDPTAAAMAMAHRGLEISSARGDTSAWRLAEARLTLDYCRVRNSDRSVNRQQATADVETIREHFTADNVFTRRADVQLAAISSADDR